MTSRRGRAAATVRRVHSGTGAEKASSNGPTLEAPDVVQRIATASDAKWLAVGTGVLAVAMAVLLGLQITQKRAIERANDLRADSVTALVFQFEREFLRFRQTLEASVIRPGAPDADNLNLRYDLFLSRLSLLRENPTTELITHRAEYQAAIPRLEDLIAKADRVMAANPLDKKDLATLLVAFNTIGVDVQALSLAANSEVAALLESQDKTMLQQNDEIIRLTLAQLLFLLLAGSKGPKMFAKAGALHIATLR